MAGKKEGGSGKIAALAPSGEPLGFDIEVGPASPEAETPRDVALSRIRGWSTFTLDGEPLEYSPKNAELLLGRQPYLVAQIAESSPSEKPSSPAAEAQASEAKE